MMYYAMIDTTARKSNPGYGFANAKRALAFSTKAKLNAFLDEREDYDFSAKRITRREAMKMLETIPHSFKGRDKGLSLDGPDTFDYVTLRESNY